jgi:uncharacterized protein DUF2442
MHEITKVEPLEKYQLRVTFDDGVEGMIDVAELTNLEGIFAPLRDPVKFRRVRVHDELGTVYWPNGADLDPDALYALVTGRPINFPAPAETS